MGQQQLLLTILVTIVIGVAIVVAIDTMQEAQRNANESAVRQDILAVLHDAQSYYRKPAMMGGGSNSFDGITEEHILSIDPDNENGTYDISGSGNSVTVEGHGTHDEVALSATATMGANGMEVTWSNINN